MIVGVLTTCHTQYTWDSSICIFLFNRTTLQVFVTYLTGALYVRPSWFYKHQHEKRVRSKPFVACQHVAFSLPFATILVNCAPTGEMHNYCTPHIIKENYENFLIHRCNYILLSQVYCVWQVVKTPTINLNNPVLYVLYGYHNSDCFPIRYYVSGFITATASAYCAVRAESLNTVHANLCQCHLTNALFSHSTTPWPLTIFGIGTHSSLSACSGGPHVKNWRQLVYPTA